MKSNINEIKIYIYDILVCNWSFLLTLVSGGVALQNLVVRKEKKLVIVKIEMNITT